MTVKELKEQLTRFKDEVEIIVTDWRVETFYHAKGQSKINFPTVKAVSFDQVFSRVDLRIGL